jgi:hypothetical protein
LLLPFWVVEGDCLLLSDVQKLWTCIEKRKERGIEELDAGEGCSISSCLIDNALEGLAMMQFIR